MPSSLAMTLSPSSSLMALLPWARPPGPTTSRSPVSQLPPGLPPLPSLEPVLTLTAFLPNTWVPLQLSRPHQRDQQIHHLSAVPWSVIPAGESSPVTKPGAPFTVCSSRKSVSAIPQPSVLILSLPPCNSLQMLHGESLSRATAFCLSVFP